MRLNSFPHTLPSNDASKITSANMYVGAMANGSHSDGVATSYGSYYNYMAASAGTATSSVTSGEISQDICSKNWHLPSESQYATLVKNPAGFTMVHTGEYWNGALGWPQLTHFWTRSVYNSTTVWSPYISGSSFWAGYHDESRAYGESMRCISR